MCEALTLQINILRVFLSFYLSSTLVKAEGEDQFDLYFSVINGTFCSRSPRTVTIVSLSSASEHANNNKIILKVLTLND